MAELTRAQINAAVNVAAPMIGNAYCTEDVLMAAVPFLQLPWDEPNSEECSAMYETASNSLRCNNGNIREAVKCAAGWLIARRNAALMPKVDPRRELIANVLAAHLNAYNYSDQLIDRLLEVSKVKP